LVQYWFHVTLLFHILVSSLHGYTECVTWLFLYHWHWHNTPFIWKRWNGVWN